MHEGQCQKSKCANELCSLSLEGMPDTVKFKINDEDKISCSKKCKKVARFQYLLKKSNETEVLRAFESMLRKKMTKSTYSSSIQAVVSHSIQSLPTNRVEPFQSLQLSQQVKHGFTTQRSAN
jgi:hypothetical protein